MVVDTPPPRPLPPLPKSREPSVRPINGEGLTSEGEKADAKNGVPTTSDCSAIGKVYVCILTYNRLQKLRHLIDNPLFWQGFDHLFVLSQASQDGTDEWLAEYAAANPDNPMTWWASWQNLMAIGGRQRLIDRLIGGGLQPEDIVIMLDDDMMVVSPRWAERLVAPMRTHGAPLIGACGVGGHNVFWGGGLFKTAPAGECDIVNGGWTAYRGRAFLEGVEVDQRYLPFWHADSDLAMQVRALGYTVWCTGPVGLAHAPHHHEVDDLWRERREMFIAKWQGRGLTMQEKTNTARLQAVAEKYGDLPEPAAVVSVYAPSYDPFDGYGRMGLELVYHLAAKNIHANALGMPRTKILHESQSEEMQRLLDRPIAMSTGGLLLGYPTLHEQFGEMATAGTTVAVTMWESTKLPEGWVEALNKCAAVIVPSEFLVKVFKKCGVHKPIHVVPLGVSETFFTEGQRPTRLTPTEHDPFTFLCWGDRGTRKGWDLVAQAFHKAFGERRDVRLIIKAREGAFPYEFPKNGNIDVLRADLDEEALRDLYLRCDCMVFPSRGEGFGLPPREFAATAGPVIATEWWADDIQQWGYPIHYQMIDAWNGHEQYKGLGKWAEPDLEHLVKQMTQVMNQDPRVIAYMGARSATRVQKIYTWEKFAEGVWQVWEDAQRRVAKREMVRKRRGNPSPSPSP